MDFYTMPRPSELWIALFTKVNYELRVVSVQASPGVQPADLSCFKWDLVHIKRTQKQQK